MTTTEKPLPPPHSITVLFAGKEREIFMSFALLNKLCYVVGAMENLHLTMLNPEMRSAVLREMFAERTAGGKLVVAYDLDECEVSLEDTMRVLEFVQEHLLDFFMSALLKTQALQERYKVSSLTPTPIG